MTLRSLLRSLWLPPVAVGLAACGGSHSTPAAQPPVPAAAPASAMAQAGGITMPSGVTAQMVAVGDSIFNAPRSCNRCHGKEGAGGRGGPELDTGKYQHVDGSYDSIVHLIDTGVPRDSIKDPKHRFPMRERGGLDLTDGQVRDVAAYVWTLGHHG